MTDRTPWRLVPIALALAAIAVAASCSNSTAPKNQHGTYRLVTADGGKPPMPFVPLWTQWPKPFITGATLQIFSADSMALWTNLTYIDSVGRVTGEALEYELMAPYFQRGDSLFLVFPDSEYVATLRGTSIDVTAHYVLPPSTGFSAAVHQLHLTQ